MNILVDSYLSVKSTKSFIFPKVSSPTVEDPQLLTTGKIFII